LQKNVYFMFMDLFWRKRTSIDLSKKSGTKFSRVGKTGVNFFLILLCFIIFVFALYYYREVHQLRTVISQYRTMSFGDDPQTEAIIAVERHILLPQGETPQLARVTELKQLANIPFFGNALVGDEVLVYCKASLSILYSPARDKVIEVSRQPVGGSCPK
jgi:hypothetical protein